MVVATFWTNPQYRVTIVDPDSDDDDGNGTLLIGLMQKERRKLKQRRKGQPHHWILPSTRLDILLCWWLFDLKSFL